MIALVLSVVCSSFIFVIFKLYKRFGVDTLQAIVFNYFTACILGLLLFNDQWKPALAHDLSWLKYALFCGFLFIALFFIMGKSSQQNGVASTSVAVKMSMAVSLIAMIVFAGSPFGPLHFLGISLAILGVFLVSYSKTDKVSAAWMLFVLFVGSGILDYSLFHIQESVLNGIPTSIFSAIGLGCAGALGFFYLLILFILKKRQFAWKNVFAGIVLGVPNYFSIYLLMQSYTTTGWNEITVLSITNVSVVVLSALLGFLAFREKASKQKLLGLISAIFAIVVLYYSNQI